jgi:ABC-2 type transport system permease protein
MRAVVRGAPPPWSLLWVGAGLAVAYLALAWMFFAAIYRYAIRSGLIARYSAESVA